MPPTSPEGRRDALVCLQAGLFFLLTSFIKQRTGTALSQTTTDAPLLLRPHIGRTGATAVCSSSGRQVDGRSRPSKTCKQ